MTRESCGQGAAGADIVLQAACRSAESMVRKEYYAGCVGIENAAVESFFMWDACLLWRLLTVWCVSSLVCGGQLDVCERLPRCWERGVVDDPHIDDLRRQEAPRSRRLMMSGYCRIWLRGCQARLGQGGVPFREGCARGRGEV